MNTLAWDNISTADIIIFSMAITIMSIVLLSGLFIYGKKYIAEKRQIITIRKLTIIALFFSIFIAQSYFTMLMGLSPVIPFSLDTLTVIAVAFLFGPIEGIVYGLTADITRVLINGWAFQALPMFIFPMIALLAGGMGRWYRNEEKDFNRKQALIFSQITIFTLIVMSSLAILGTELIGDTETTDTFYISAIIAAVVSVFILELMLYWFFKKENDANLGNELKLFVFIFAINVLSRITMGWLVRSYAQYFYWGYPFSTQILTRIITSSYLIPARTILSYALIKSSIFAMKQTKNPDNW